MDHHLDESLNLESELEVDFASTASLPLDASNEADASMSLHSDVEFQQIHDHPDLMETVSEEVIGADLMDTQFTLPNEGLHQPVQQVLQQRNQVFNQEKVPAVNRISVSASNIAPKPQTSNTAPKLLKIAPKPPPLRQIPISGMPGNVKQVILSPNVMGSTKNSLIKNLIHVSKSPTGKQLIVVPAGAAGQLKILKTDSDHNLKMISTFNDGRPTTVTSKLKTANISKQLPGKVLMQAAGSPGTTQKVFAKILPSGTGSPDKYILQPKVMQKVGSQGQKVIQPSKMQFQTIQKMVPAHKIAPGQTQAKPQLIQLSSGQSAVRIMNNKFVTVTSPNQSKMVDKQGPQVPTTKKIMVVPKQNQGMVMKQTGKPQSVLLPSGTQQLGQLHPINIPGKGVQYIRLVPASSQTSQSTDVHKKTVVSIPPKTILISSSKGNLMQNSQSSVVVSGGATLNKLPQKPVQKLVRIAPLPATTQYSKPQPQPRSSQSLLAPIFATAAESVPAPETAKATPLPTDQDRPMLAEEDCEMQDLESSQEIDDKAVLRRLIGIKSEDISLEEATEFMPVDVESNGQAQDESIVVDGAGEANQSHSIMMESDYEPTEQVGVNPFENETFVDFQLAAGAPPAPPIPSVGSVLDKLELNLKPRKVCNCTKSQCLKLYCDCFANGEFCNNCNCNNCHNNIEHEALRLKAIRGCLERNPNAFKPKIGKAKAAEGPDTVRRHNKGCNCKRSGCLKNYCECFEAKIACSGICKCVGCRNVEDLLVRHQAKGAFSFMHDSDDDNKAACKYMTSEVVEAVCQCMLAAAVEPRGAGDARTDVEAVMDEFGRCMQDVLRAAHAVAAAAAAASASHSSPPHHKQAQLAANT